MAIIIKKVADKKDLKAFIRFNYELYKNNPYAVPDLYDDMLNTFRPRKMQLLNFVSPIIFWLIKTGSWWDVWQLL